MVEADVRRCARRSLALQLPAGKISQTDFLCLQLLLGSSWLWLAMALCCSAQSDKTVAGRFAGVG